LIVRFTLWPPRAGCYSDLCMFALTVLQPSKLDANL